MATLLEFGDEGEVAETYYLKQEERRKARVSVVMFFQSASFH